MNYPTNPIAAPAACGGLGLNYLQMEQGVEAMNLIVSMWVTCQPRRFLLKDTLELMQQESSLAIPTLKVIFK